MKYPPQQMIMVDLVGCMLSLLMIVSFPSIQAILWLGSILTGLSIASIYASAINWAERRISVSGKILSLLVVCASTGEAVLPLLMGAMFQSSIGPQGMMIIAFACAVSATACFLILMKYIAPKLEVKQDGPKKAIESTGNVSVAVEPKVETESSPVKINGMNGHELNHVEETKVSPTEEESNPFIED